MNTRAELRLGVIIGLAVLGTGLLVWGARSGQLVIFGDVIPLRVAESISVAVRPVDTATTGVVELFDSLTHADIAATTARWDSEAGNLTLVPGTTSGRAQSGTIAAVTGQLVTVSLSATVKLPTGSRVYYAISADGGATWEPIFPGRAVTFTDVTTGDWRWRALLERGDASLNPTLEELSLTFVVSDE